MSKTIMVYQMTCLFCGYTCRYFKKWEAEASAEAHEKDNFCGKAETKVEGVLTTEPHPWLNVRTPREREIKSDTV